MSLPERLPTLARAGKLAAMLAALPGLFACRADRVLLIASDPPGAQVLLDGKEIGATPLEHEFVHYGTRRLTFRLEGHLTYSEVLELEPPWYGRFPLDLVSEILVPLGWRDEHDYRVELEPGRSTIAEPDLESVLRRADTLRTAGPEGPRPDMAPESSEPANAAEASAPEAGEPSQEAGEPSKKNGTAPAPGDRPQ